MQTRHDHSFEVQTKTIQIITTASANYYSSSYFKKGILPKEGEIIQLPSKIRGTQIVKDHHAYLIPYDFFIEHRISNVSSLFNVDQNKYITKSLDKSGNVTLETNCIKGIIGLKKELHIANQNTRAYLVFQHGSNKYVLATAQCFYQIVRICKEKNIELQGDFQILGDIIPVDLTSDSSSQNQNENTRSLSQQNPIISAEAFKCLLASPILVRPSDLAATEAPIALEVEPTTLPPGLENKKRERDAGSEIEYPLPKRQKNTNLRLLRVEDKSSHDHGLANNKFESYLLSQIFFQSQPDSQSRPIAGEVLDLSETDMSC